jgi:LPS-assembly lipoprotein
MWWSRPLAAVVLAAALVGCGFKPMYRESSDNGTTAAEFAYVSIAQPEDRRDQLLRNDLLDLLTPLGSPDRPRYLLEYKVDESIGAVFTTRSEEVTRNNLILTVAYRLRDYQSGKVLQSISTTSYASYNLTVADYSNLISEKNARERALRDSAEQLRIRLGNYFGKYSKDRPAK